MTNAFLHDISMSMAKDSTGRKTKATRAKTKKYKHQSLSRSLLFFQPNSKYFKGENEDSSASQKHLQKLSCRLDDAKNIITVDNGFVIFDFLRTMETTFDNLVLDSLTMKNLIIGEPEKKVRVIRSSECSK